MAFRRKSARRVSRTSRRRPARGMRRSRRGGGPGKIGYRM